MNGKTRNLHRALPGLLLTIGLAGCAGSQVNLSNSLAPGLAPASRPALASRAPAVDSAASAAAVQAVEKALPRLRGMAADRQLQTLRWMLSVGDDRRLVSLFDDLRENRGEPVDRRAATARQRLEELATDLERAGHQAAEPDAEVARIDTAAPAPNYYPPSMIVELEKRQATDPEAARLLEEIRRTAPRGNASRPPAP